MAEFCLDCLRKLDGKPYDPKEFELSSDLELCEGCGQWKHVVVIRKATLHLGILGGFINCLKDLLYWLKTKTSD